MQNRKDVYLLTGSNIEPRTLYLRNAKQAISEQLGEIVNESSVYESEAWGFTANKTFLNQVLLIRSSIKAEELLAGVLEIEKLMGRLRTENGYSSRTIDIDILYYGDEVIENDKLVVPHPRIKDRNFTLAPLNEIAGSFVHPVLQITNKELLEQTTDRGKVWLFEYKNAL
jgi:2-amino-4-hydroxy-6-hydroxymethyldihydropteridine diphosphokinase